MYPLPRIVVIIRVYSVKLSALNIDSPILINIPREFEQVSCPLRSDTIKMCSLRSRHMDLYCLLAICSMLCNMCVYVYAIVRNAFNQIHDILQVINRHYNNNNSNRNR